MREWPIGAKVEYITSADSANCCSYDYLYSTALLTQTFILSKQTTYKGKLKYLSLNDNLLVACDKIT